jgi:hypothetical protein
MSGDDDRIKDIEKEYGEMMKEFGELRADKFHTENEDFDPQ